MTHGEGGAAGDRDGPGGGGREVPGVRRTHAYLEGTGGIRLFYRCWEPSEPDATVLLVHGLGEHSGRWARTAGVLAAAGLAVYALDLRGHGRSRGRRGHAAAFDHLLRDLDRLRRTAAPAAPEGSVVLVGHSMGGLVVLRHLRAFPTPAVAGAVAVAPFVQLRAEVPGWKLTFGRLADRWLPGLTLDSGMGSDLVLRRPEARERRRRDPLVHRRISARLWGEMQRASRRLSEDPRTGRPVLLQVPGDDLVVDTSATGALADRLIPAAEVRAYPDAYHDLYHEPEGPEALEDALGWIRRRVGAGR